MLFGVLSKFLGNRIEAVQPQLRSQPETSIRALMDRPDRIFTQAGWIVGGVAVMGKGSKRGVKVIRVIQIQLVQSSAPCPGPEMILPIDIQTNNHVMADAGRVFRVIAVVCE